MSLRLSERVARLEAARRTALVRLAPTQIADAVRRYEASLHNQEEPDPRAQAYWATTTLHQLASDYDAMLKGALAPWE